MLRLAWLVLGLSWPVLARREGCPYLVHGTWDSGHFNLLLLLEPAAMTTTGSAHWGQGEAGMAGGWGQLACAG